MPITTQQMATDVSPVPEFTWGSGTVNVTYSPSMLTEETLANMQVIENPQALSLADNTKAMNAALAALVVSWDVYEDKEMTIVTPRTDEALRKLPIMFRATVLRKILESFVPNETGSITQSE